MSRADVITAVRETLLPVWYDERDHYDRIRKWYRHEHEPVRLPNTATLEQRLLAELARTPWLGLVVSAVAQQMYVDGYRTPQDSVNDPANQAWETWNANDLDSRQVAIHRAALAYGVSFMTVLPGVDDQGARTAAMRGVSPRKMVAIYQDPAEDDWPMLAMRVDKQKDDRLAIRVYDEVNVYSLSSDHGGTDLRFIEEQGHGADVVPVVRYANMLDLDGLSDGEVEPFIPIAARVNKTIFDRLLVQHFSSYKVRWATGLEKPATPQETADQKLKLAIGDILVADGENARFGTLDATDMRGFIDAAKSEVQALAAASQTPTTTLTGDMVNLSADALAEARAGLDQKVKERQTAFGKSHAQALRLAAHIQGDEEAAHDTQARVTWQDTSVRSMAQAVDALGKAATMLGVPPQELWSRIPNVTKSDVEEWKAAADSKAALDFFAARAAAPAAGPQTPAKAPPGA